MLVLPFSTTSSPAATFIAYNYNTQVDAQLFERDASQILQEVEAEMGWMYSTVHKGTDTEISALAGLLRRSKDETACRTILADEKSAKEAGRGCRKAGFQLGRILSVVWSDVFSCRECGSEVVFWEAAVDQATGKVEKEFPCPTCRALVTKRRLRSCDYNIL